jgi:hypothetical protein
LLYSTGTHFKRFGSEIGCLVSFHASLFGIISPGCGKALVKTTKHNLNGKTKEIEVRLKADIKNNSLLSSTVYKTRVFYFK